MISVPRVIYSAWLQGAAQAPAIVQLCFTRWARLNPECRFQALDISDAKALLARENLPPLPAQALSDIMRVKMLLDQGGVWVDASLFPVVPLQNWLPAAMSTAFFAFAQPGPDRPISSWFMAAAPQHMLLQKLWAEVQRFWSKPRQPVHYATGLIPPDPVASVAPNAGGASDYYPYFWLHYLFQYLLDTDPDFAAVWAMCRQVPAGPPHNLQAACAAGVDAPTMLAVARTAPVQKLDWRAAYPLDLLAQV